MVVQANPNTQPGGVQGAFFRFWYQSEGTPSCVNNPPKNKPVKLISKKINILNDSLTPPFTVENQTDGGEELRMKYRFIDIRSCLLYTSDAADD